eukprot:scaffold76920_cov32-Tisochrysis_lutea.AAC.1
MLAGQPRPLRGVRRARRWTRPLWPLGIHRRDGGWGANEREGRGGDGAGERGEPSLSAPHPFFPAFAPPRV